MIHVGGRLRTKWSHPGLTDEIDDGGSGGDVANTLQNSMSEEKGAELVS